MTEHLFDLEEQVGLRAFGFAIEPDGATATLPPREATIKTTGGMELIITHPNGDHVFFGCRTLIGTVGGVEYRGEIGTAKEKDVEKAAGLFQLGFVDDDCDPVYEVGYRWGAGTVSVQIVKKGGCAFDTVITFANGDKLYIACDFLCGKICGVEWADSVQRGIHGMDPSPLLASCA